MNVQVRRGKQKRGWEAAEEKELMECLADEAMPAKKNKNNNNNPQTKDANAKPKPKTQMQKGATKFAAWAERVYRPGGGAQIAAESGMPLRTGDEVKNKKDNVHK
jgi:hypothetical protein